MPDSLLLPHNNMKLTIDDNHLLQGDNVNHISTPKNKIKFKAGNRDAIVIHYTAGGSAESSANYLAQKDVKASAHLVIGRGGEIYQLVPFDTISWHAGKSSYGGRTHYNRFSIGIELDNAGILTKTGSEFQSWFGRKYQQSDVMEAIHRNESSSAFWHTYTETQLQVNEQICKLLLTKYPDIVDILGHEEIAVGRKQDPGPAFPLDRFRRRLLGDSRDDDESGAAKPLPEEGEVVPEKLNVRGGAGTQFEKISRPLKGGQKLKILAEENGWYKVCVEIEGWVSKGHVKTS